MVMVDPLLPECTKPQSIGVFGGSFNPIHLGHALLAITTQQTKPVDSVVLVPVFKHHVKTDLLPFDDRVKMCELAVAPYRGECGQDIRVSTIEKDVGESNAKMLQALKARYPKGSKLFWICGDDVFDWIENPKGLETMREVSGLIVQRRLHKAHASGGADRFFKAPLDEARICAIAAKLDLKIEFIYGELPHFSSTLVRRAPGNWRSFLPQTVAKYLDARPDLLEKLQQNLEADAKAETAAQEPLAKRRRLSSRQDDNGRTVAAVCVMHGVEAIHALQFERGQTGLRLSMGLEAASKLVEARENVDSTIRSLAELTSSIDESGPFGLDESFALAAELKQIPSWLNRDRAVIEKYASALTEIDGAKGWEQRAALTEKFNSRIEVIMGACIRALREILHMAIVDEQDDTLAHRLSKLLEQWAEGKEALGRLRAFVCAGGPNAANIVKSSFVTRQRLHELIEHKERRIARVLASQVDIPHGIRCAAPDALNHMLERVTAWEWCLMGCFSASTTLPLVHKLLSATGKLEKLDSSSSGIFDVEKFFVTTSTTIDLMLDSVKALAATACAKA